MRVILECEPEWVALEQVPSVLPIWAAYGEVLERRGYSVDWGLLNAECYGVPQTRKRVILVAHRTRDVALPASTHSRFYPRNPTKLDANVLPWVSMADALGWGMTERPYPAIAPGTAGGGTDPQAIGGSGSRKTIRREREDRRWIEKTWNDNPDQWQRALEYVGGNQNHSTRRPLDNPAPTVHFGARVNEVTWQPTRANLDDPADSTNWVHDRPSPTIVGSFCPDVVAAPGWRKPGDGPRQNAMGSVRVSAAEAACLQSFPDNYPWQGKKTSVYQQIGNAICPLMAEAILRSATGMD